MIYPKLRSHLIVVPIENAVTIGGTPNTSIEIEDSDGIIEKILTLCDGKNNIKDILNSLINDGIQITNSDLKQVIDELFEIPYLMEYASQNVNERDSRTLNFLSNFDIDGSKKEEYLGNIQRSAILIIGLGGAGSNFAINMASLGIKKIVAVDFDVVDISNLNRQVLFNENSIGEKKVSAAKKNIHNLNSNCEFIAIDKKVNNSSFIIDLINKYNIDYLLCAADTPTFKILDWCNEACHTCNIPWSYTGMGEYITHFHTIFPKKTSCYKCIEKDILSNPDTAEKYLNIKEHQYKAQNDCILANSSLAASYLAFDTIKILGKLENTDIMSLGKRVHIDHFTNNITIEKMKKNKSCHFCF